MNDDTFDASGMSDLDEPVVFPVSIGGKMLTATVLAIGYEGQDIVYKIRFSDGYTHYIHQNEEGVHGESQGSRTYVEAILQDLHILQFYEPGKLLHNFRYTVKREVNVWIQQSSLSGELAFAVHYFGHCQFWMHKVEGKWEIILPNQSDNGIDDEFIRQIGFLLDSLT